MANMNAMIISFNLHHRLPLGASWLYWVALSVQVALMFLGRAGGESEAHIKKNTEHFNGLAWTVPFHRQ